MSLNCSSNGFKLLRGIQWRWTLVTEKRQSLSFSFSRQITREDGQSLHTTDPRGLFARTRSMHLYITHFGDERLFLTGIQHLFIGDWRKMIDSRENSSDSWRRVSSDGVDDNEILGQFIIRFKTELNIETRKNTTFNGDEGENDWLLYHTAGVASIALHRRFSALYRIDCNSFMFSMRTFTLINGWDLQSYLADRVTLRFLHETYLNWTIIFALGAPIISDG